MYSDARCVDINGLKGPDYDTTVMVKNVYVISGPDWGLRGVGGNITSNQSKGALSEMNYMGLQSVYDQFNNE
jgi:hypothetical protein